MVNLTQNQINDLQAIVLSGESGSRIAYYSKLASFGIPYGTLALGVVLEDTLSGRTASQYLKISGIKEGKTITTEQIDKIGDSLMLSDFQARSINSFQMNGQLLFRDLNYLQIRGYHVISYDTLGGTVSPGQGLSPNAWTAYAPIETLGYSRWNDMINNPSTFSYAVMLAEMQVAANNDPDNKVVSDWIDRVVASTPSSMTGLGSPLNFAQHVSDSQIIMGTTGNDVISDEVVAAPKNKKLFLGLSGNDTFNVITTAVNESFYDGGEGDDTFLVTGNLKTEIHGGYGTDLIDLSSYASAISMVIRASTEKSGSLDVLFRGVEGILGSALADTFQFSTLAKSTDVRILNGGDGTDTLIMPSGGSAHNATDHTVDLEAGLMGQNTSLVSIENVTGNNGYDIIKGDSKTNVLRGEVNPDQLDGRGGDDLLYGGGENDTLSGGDGNDQIYGKRDYDTITGGQGDDTIAGGYAGDQINGDAGNDLLYGGDVSGTEGNFDHGDTISGDAGNDTVRSGNGNDSVFGGKGNDILDAGEGDDSVEGQDGSDYMTGKTGNDTMYGGEDYDTLYGDDGSDKLYGGNGNDTIYGGAADDFIFSGSGNNMLYGGSGSDLFTGGEGLDRIGDFEISIDRLSRSGFTNVTYQLSGSSGELRIISGDVRFIVADRQILQHFHEQGQNEDEISWIYQFNILWDI